MPKGNIQTPAVVRLISYIVLLFSAVDTLSISLCVFAAHVLRNYRALPAGVIVVQHPSMGVFVWATTERSVDAS